jgi:hypothetical protein
MFFLFLAVVGTRIEILPSYAGVPVAVNQFLTEELESYGLENSAYEGTYSFFYYQKNEPLDYTPILELLSDNQSVSQIGLNSTGYSSVWGDLSNFLEIQTNITANWVLIVLSISYKDYLELDFCVFAPNKYSQSSYTNYSTPQPVFIQSMYFLIGGSEGLIHSLNVFTTIQDPVSLSQSSFLTPFMSDTSSMFLLNVSYS